MAFEFTITIDKTKVSGSQTDFPYLFSVDTSTIPAGFWTNVLDPDGLDIRFYDTDGTTELDREIVLYDSATPEVEAWVKIPLLEDTADKVIYCRYGGASAVNSPNVWLLQSADVVLHCQRQYEPSPGVFKTVDSTGLGDATCQNVDFLPGRIGNGVTYDNNVELLGINRGVHLGLYTIDAWFYNTGIAGNVYRIIANDHSAGSNGSFFFGVTDNDFLAIFGTTGLGIAAYNTVAGWRGVGVGGTYASWSNAWFKATATWDGNRWRIYVNGLLAATSGVVALDPNNPTMTFGNFAGIAWTQWIGRHDELRIYHDAKDAGYILTDFNNQSDPATFSFCGPESMYPPSSSSGFRPGKTRGPFTG